MKGMGSKKRTKMIDERFGSLVVIEEVGPGTNHDRLFLCRCDCDNEKVFSMNSLRRGKTKSCGCKVQETIEKMNKINESFRIDGIQTTALTRKAPKNNTSGVKGVSIEYTKSGKKVYGAYISVGGIKHRLGKFDSKEEAVEARKAAVIKYHEPILKKANILNDQDIKSGNTDLLR